MKKLIKTSAFKSALIFIVAFLLVWLYLFKQVEDKLKNAYQQQGLKGRVELHSILPQFESGSFKIIYKAHYSYIEKVDGKEERFKIALTLPKSNFILPYYQNEFKENEDWYGKERYDTAQAYAPIYQRAIELNPQLPLLKKQIENATSGIPFFENRKFKILDVSYDDIDSYYEGDSLYNNDDSSKRALGGRYGLSLLESLQKGNIIIIFEQGEKEGIRRLGYDFYDYDDIYDSESYEENFKKLAKNGAPIGNYYLWPSEKIKKNDFDYLGKSKVRVYEGNAERRRY